MDETQSLQLFGTLLSRRLSRANVAMLLVTLLIVLPWVRFHLASTNTHRDSINYCSIYLGQQRLVIYIYREYISGSYHK